ncbi:hypothetical protein BJV78DRAFT_1362909 [Lactifluus subvellereus]|nr:hypothetical protein BJV78DRAFT_1362909 [Lactifluus subvellereus]
MPVDPDRHQKAKPCGTGSTKTAEKEEILEARTLKREEREEARRVEVEKLKEPGNAHFHAGEYLKAIEEYDAAIKIHGPSAAYLSNMVAAWLKLEAYDAAEHCARPALVLDPLFMKARYRRGLARKGNLELAHAAVGPSFIRFGVSQHFALQFIVARNLVRLEATLPLLRHCDRRLHDTAPHVPQELLPVRIPGVVVASLGDFASVILVPLRSFGWPGTGTYARVVATIRSSSSEVIIDIAGRSLGSEAAGAVILSKHFHHQ